MTTETTAVSEGNPGDADGWSWAEEMYARYGEAPEDFPARAPGQSDADYRAAVEAMMADRTAATAEPPSGDADEPLGGSAGAAPDPPSAGGSGDAAVDESTTTAVVAAEPTAGTGTSEATAEGAASDTATQNDERPTNEAARYRLRLRETEAKLEETRNTADWLITEARHLIDATRQSIIDRELGRTGLDPALLVAAGHTADTLLDDTGLIDHERLASAIESTIVRFHVDVPDRPRRPQPVPAVGRGSTPPGMSELAKFTAKFKR